jgi:hypothetical protein
LTILINGKLKILAKIGGANQQTTLYCKKKQVGKNFVQFSFFYFFLFRNEILFIADD